jgi:hypothetical protein
MIAKLERFSQPKQELVVWGLLESTGTPTPKEKKP